MNRSIRRSLVALLFLAAFGSAGGAIASELVYTPTNPSFGGSPLNGQWMQSYAESQSRFKEPAESAGSSPFAQKNAVETFRDNLSRQVLNLLAQKISEFASGSGTLPSGPITIDGFEITLISDASSITVSIFDPATSNTTTLVIPFF